MNTNNKFEKTKVIQIADQNKSSLGEEVYRFQHAESDKKSLRILCIGVAVLIAAAATAISGAWGSIQISSNTYAITSVAIVDAEEGVVLRDHTVVITGDRIDAVGPQSEISVSEKAKLIDGKGLYLIPGLIDSDVHYFDPSTFGRLLIVHGIVLVRDMGNPTVQALGLREKLEKKEILGPEMIVTGSFLAGFEPEISTVCKNT